MPRFSEEWMSNLLSKNNIVDVVSDYVSLTKKGTRYWASCPFHNEKNASFTVTPDREMFYCFSCKRGGGVINFIMEQEHLDYLGAVRFLAERAGIPMPEETDDKDWEKKKQYRKRLTEMMREAALYFNSVIKSPEGRAGYAYMEKRGLSHLIGKFGIGYAKDSFNDLRDHLLKKGYTQKEMMDAFLVRQNKGNTYDISRNRVIIPIINLSGEVIAFGGRIIGDGEPKYLNSSDTPIFNKRYNLFGLNMLRGRNDIRSIILTEGYMDVISMYAAGITNAVASLGTALTKEQARLIKRYSPNVFISYDGDMAGINAAYRAVDILEGEGLFVKVITIPNNMDPDDFCKKYGKAGYVKLAKQARSGFEFKLYRTKMDFDMNDADSKTAYATKAAELISGLKNEIQKERYIKFLANETGISESTIKAQVTGEEKNIPVPENREQVLMKTAQDADEEAKLMALLLSKPDLITGLDLTAEDFKTYEKLYFYIFEQIKKGFLPNSGELISGFSLAYPQEKHDFAELISVREPEGIVNKAHYAMTLSIRMKIKMKQDKLRLAREEFAAADEEKRRSALLRIAELDREIRALQERLNRG
ncbi:MAG: DNA primase [Christensenellaceae bacterium]|nr:DNA primase [Christensenellaceae bacterium]